MFENEETYRVIKEKVMPALEELARTEFGVFSATGNIDEETKVWMRESNNKLAEAVTSYLDGLLLTHIRYGEELKKLGCQFNNGGDGSERNVSEM